MKWKVRYIASIAFAVLVAVPSFAQQRHYFSRSCAQYPNRSTAAHVRYRALEDYHVKPGYGPCEVYDTNGKLLYRVNRRVEAWQSPRAGWYHAGDFVWLPRDLTPDEIQIGKYQGVFRDGCGNDLIFMELPRLIRDPAEEAYVPPMPLEPAAPAAPLPVQQVAAPVGRADIFVGTEKASAITESSASLSGYVKTQGYAGPAICWFNIRGRDGRMRDRRDRRGDSYLFETEKVRVYVDSFGTPVSQYATNLRDNQNYEFQHQCQADGLRGVGEWVPFETERLGFCRKHYVACPVLIGLGTAAVIGGVQAYRNRDDYNPPYKPPDQQPCFGYCTTDPVTQPPLWPGGGNPVTTNPGPPWTGTTTPGIPWQPVTPAQPGPVWPGNLPGGGNATPPGGGTTTQPPTGGTTQPPGGGTTQPPLWPGGRP